MASSPESYTELGRALGHFIFSLIGLKRILFTNNIFQKLSKPRLVKVGQLWRSFFPSQFRPHVIAHVAPQPFLHHRP